MDPGGSGSWVITVTFNSAAARVWADFTSANVGSQVAVVFDGEVLSAPTIVSAITNGQTVISGDFTHDQADQLAISLTGR